MLAERMDWPGTPVKAVLACQHKLHARRVLKTVAPEANTSAELLPARYGEPIPDGLRHPVFVKPVKAAFPVLACIVHEHAELTTITRFGTWELWVIRHLVDPFARIIAKRLPEAGSAHRLMLETPASGQQYKLGGYVFAGELNVLGFVESVMCPGTQACMQFVYPCPLSIAMRERAVDVAWRFLRAVGFTHGPFNMEFFYDDTRDHLTIIQFDPRMAAQFSDLYLHVDGVGLHRVALQLAHGRDPRCLSHAAPSTGAAACADAAFSRRHALPVYQGARADCPRFQVTGFLPLWHSASGWTGCPGFAHPLRVGQPPARLLAASPCAPVSRSGLQSAASATRVFAGERVMMPLPNSTRSPPQPVAGSPGRRKRAGWRGHGQQRRPPTHTALPQWRRSGACTCPAENRDGDGSMTSPRLLQIAPEMREQSAEIRAELLAGLTAPSASIAPKYLYDALGSRLFAAITELPEYYPTRTEAAIFIEHLGAMAGSLGPVDTLVDLGAGNCEKAAALFAALRVRRYVAVDISLRYLRESLENLQQRHPAIEMLGIGLDFSLSLQLPAELDAGPRTLFYPGSSIGNFTPQEALSFLRQAHAECRGGSLLISVDLVKPVAILEAAYDDPLGVTAAFNRNLLLNLNRLTGTDFAIADWCHVAFFNHAESRIEMHLQALRDTTVRWDGGERHFVAAERMHTENSYKWRSAEFAALLERAGFATPRHWCDARGWFAVFAAQA